MNIRRLLSLFLMLVFVGMPCLPCAAQETRVFVDSVGREVEVPVQIDRIAPSGKMAHIVLYALSPEKFVCLSNPWTRQAEQYFDPQFLNLPVVGQFYGESALNREALAAAAPQVIIDLGQRKKAWREIWIRSKHSWGFRPCSLKPIWRIWIIATRCWATC
ncbi:MAG: hypothetical protein RR482_06165 [Clostridia bacterium]